MRVMLALGWYLPDSIGGTEIYVQGLADRLQRKGVTVCVAAPEPGASAPRTYVHAGVDVYRYPIPAEPSRAEAHGTAAVRGTEHFHAFVDEWKPDVLHIHTIRLGLGIDEFEFAKRRGIRTVTTNHLPSFGWLCQRGTLMRWGQTPCDGICKPVKCAACELQHRGLPKPVAQGAAALSWATRGALRHLPGRAGSMLSMTHVIEQNLARQARLTASVDHILVLNEQARAIARAHGAPDEKLGLCRLGVSLPDLDPKPTVTTNPTTAPLRIGFVARLHPNKGANLLLEAFLGLPDNDAQLEFCGPYRPGEETEHVNALKARAAGNDQVRFLDAIPGDQVAALLRTYDVLCCPSRWFENGPTVALEARAVGTPVIGSRIGNLAELIRDDVDGALHGPLDMQGLRTILARIIQDPSVVDRWRDALPRTRTMDDIVVDTLAAYGATP